MNSKSDIRSRILEIVENDTTGLLSEEQSRKNNNIQELTIIQKKISKIIDFVENYGQLPIQNNGSIVEHQLASGLENLRIRNDFYDLVMQLNPSNLVREKLLSITHDQNLSKVSDKYNLLSEYEDREILKLVNVKKNFKINPYYMSHRNRCLDFYNYENIFLKVHQDLASGSRKLVQFNVKDLNKGVFFVLSGVLGYLANVNIDNHDFNFDSGARNRLEGRTLCIFDNGTESKMLYRSLIKAIQTDGFLVSDYKERVNLNQTPELSDLSLGYIYVLKSESPQLQEYENLYKIGFTSGLVSSRIAKCEKEATYLFSRVRVISTYRCYNINAGSVEETLHKIFEKRRLDIKLKDKQGNTYQPKEWFQVDLEHIERAIELILQNEVNLYSYEPDYGFILKK